MRPNRSRKEIAAKLCITSAPRSQLLPLHSHTALAPAPAPEVAATTTTTIKMTTQNKWPTEWLRAKTRQQPRKTSYAASRLNLKQRPCCYSALQRCFKTARAGTWSATKTGRNCGRDCKHKAGNRCELSTRVISGLSTCSRLGMSSNLGAVRTKNSASLA